MPNLISPEGESYRTSNPAEVTRLRARGYSVEGELFHPADHKVDEVLAYIEANPADASRVIAEERASAKPRTSIVGSDTED